MAKVRELTTGPLTAREPNHAVGAAIEKGQSAIVSADVRNLALIMVCFAVVVALVSPVHSYPVIDDWVYARGVNNLLHWDYKPLDSLAYAFTHVAWGTLFSLVFGFNFTSLTASTLVLSSLCLVMFYILLRQLMVIPAYALLGTAVLGFNPMYVYLSYSFMTDVPFTAVVLASLLCYVLWAKGRGEIWLWLGSLAAADALLNRQMGVLVVPALLVYMLCKRQWSWRAAFVSILIPAGALGSYLLWQHLQPTQPRLYEQAPLDYLSIKYVIYRVLRLYWSINLLGLYLLPVIRRPRKLLYSLFPFSVLTIITLVSVNWVGTLLPPDVDVLNTTGFLLPAYGAAPLWSAQIWLVLAVTSNATLAIYLTTAGETLVRWLQSKPRFGTANTSIIPYVFGFLLLVSYLFVLGTSFDRYWLLLLPIMMLPLLKGLSMSNQAKAPSTMPKQAYLRWLALLPIAAFAIVAQRDYVEHAQVRWDLANTLLNQGIEARHISGGLEWAGWQLTDAGEKYVQENNITDVSVMPGYRVLERRYVLRDDRYISDEQTPPPVISTAPYHSWLDGGQLRYVMALALRKDMEAAP